MSRIKQCFQQLAATGKKALIPYLVAGDPQPADTVNFMHQLVAAGANLIELGVPFSDPMAEGPVIQRAHERALAHNVSLQDAITMVRQFRETDAATPVVLMGYANPVEVMGYETFAAKAAAAGVDGLLTVDMPPEEATALGQALAARQLDIIYLLAPTTTEARARTICDNATGYLYYVSLKGVTGAGNLDTDAVATRLQVIRSMTQLPLCVGFGINSAEAAARIAAVADGVVVGSALVSQFDGETPPQTAMAAATVLLQSMRNGLDKTEAKR